MKKHGTAALVIGSQAIDPLCTLAHLHFHHRFQRFFYIVT